MQNVCARGVDTYTARGLSDARALLPALKPDVTALDPDLEDGDGLELIEEIVDRGSRCLVGSVREEVEYRIRALSLVADDYLLQPVQPGGTLPPIAQYPCESLPTRERLQKCDRRPPGRQGRSREPRAVELRWRAWAGVDRNGAFAAPNPDRSVNRVVSKQTLFVTVYGRSYSPGTRSLDVGISRLRIKLKSADNGAEIRSVREAGYLLSREIEGAHAKTSTYRHAEI